MWNILLVEDQETNRELLCEILKKYAYCDEAENGREGFKKYNEDFYAEKKYDIILLDLAMPEVDGISFLKLIRENEDFYHIPHEDRMPVIIITAHKERLNEAFLLGYDNFMLKPIDPSLLINKIKKNIKKQHQEVSLTVDSIMTKDVITVAPHVPILEAIERMSENVVNSLPVVDDDNTLLGIITEWDVLDLLAEVHGAGPDCVEKYMTRDVVSFTETDTVMDVSDYMQKKKLHRVPIVRDGKLVGIVGRHDIVKVIPFIRNNINLMKK